MLDWQFIEKKFVQYCSGAMFTKLQRRRVSGRETSRTRRLAMAMIARVTSNEQGPALLQRTQALHRHPRRSWRHQTGLQVAMHVAAAAAAASGRARTRVVAAAVAATAASAAVPTNQAGWRPQLSLLKLPLHHTVALGMLHRPTLPYSTLRCYMGKHTDLSLASVHYYATLHAKRAAWPRTPRPGKRSAAATAAAARRRLLPPLPLLLLSLLAMEGDCRCYRCCCYRCCCHCRRCWKATSTAAAVAVTVARMRLLLPLSSLLLSLLSIEGDCRRCRRCATCWRATLWLRPSPLGGIC